ncbi:GDSL-type esterase/lipase family protein [Candidatus Izimaplasma bacterium]|nr:GDSL-type esterase/lipase family protein [Candidatus Izimaplasma bacterium]
MIDYSKIKKRYKRKVDEIAHRDIEKGNIVLLGDCVIERLSIDKHLDNHKIYNNGISGDTTVLLMESLYKRCIKYKPSKVFIAIGSNDLGFDNRNVKEIYNNIIEIMKEISRRSSETEIHILSVIPVNPANRDYINREYVDARDNFDISMINYYLRNYARRNRIKYVDTSRAVSNNFDQLDLHYTLDGFHLNESGYEKVSNMILKYV